MADTEGTSTVVIATIAAVALIGIVFFLMNKPKPIVLTNTKLEDPGTTDLVGGGDKGTSTNVWDFLGKIVPNVVEKGYTYLVANKSNSSGDTVLVSNNEDDYVIY